MTSAFEDSVPSVDAATEEEDPGLVAVPPMVDLLHGQLDLDLFFADEDDKQPGSSPALVGKL